MTKKHYSLCQDINSILMAWLLIYMYKYSSCGYISDINPVNGAAKSGPMNPSVGMKETNHVRPHTSSY